MYVVLMAKGTEYKIKKIEKGPLARFKNQNLLLKKFGETGLQIYKAITGRRTTEELKKDLGVDNSLFDQVMTFMQDSGMVELEPVSGGEESPANKRVPAEETPEPEGPELPEEPEQPEEPEEKKASLEELPPPEETEENAPPLTEKPEPAKKKAKKAFAPEAYEEITPLDIETEAAAVETKQEGKLRPSAKKRKTAEEEVSDEISPVEEEIKPVELGGEEPAAGETGTEEAPAEEAPPEGEEQPSEEAPSEEAPPEEEAPSEGVETPKEEEEISISAFEEEEKPGAGAEELSPVEKIIFEKYGDVGLRAYSLIDGQRTAEEIMRETGLTESKLVEMLDFMDEQGIIKLDYPKSGGGGAIPAAAWPCGFRSSIGPIRRPRGAEERGAARRVRPDDRGRRIPR